MEVHVVFQDKTVEALFELAIRMESKHEEALRALGRAGQIAEVYLGRHQSTGEDFFKWLREPDESSMTTMNGGGELPKMGAE